MKTLLPLALFSMLLATSYSVLGSQTQTYPTKYVYEHNQLRYIITKEITIDTTTHYRAIDCLTKKSLEYPFSTSQIEGLLCINPTLENKFLADMYEKTASRTATTAQSTSSQSSSAATSTQGQSSSATSSLIASVISYFRKS